MARAEAAPMPLPAPVMMRTFFSVSIGRFWHAANAGVPGLQ
jgi:hypothetical protein